MNKIKLYMYLFVTIFLITVVVTVNLQAKKIKKQRAEIARVQGNNLQLMSDKRQQTTLYLTEREVTGKLRLKLDSLAKILRVKPKFIDRIVNVTITERDTIIKEVPVYVLKKDNWLIADTGKCYVWRANVTLSDNNLSVKRKEFSYQNETTSVYYRKKTKKFLFFYIGKRTNFVSVSSECDPNPVVNTFEFIK